MQLTTVNIYSDGDLVIDLECSTLKYEFVGGVIIPKVYVKCRQNWKNDEANNYSDDQSSDG